MKNKTEKEKNYFVYKFYKLGFFFLLGFLVITSALQYYPNNWDELVLTREIIEGYDVVIRYIEEGKFGEASELAESVNTNIWYLRNSNSRRTNFYDDLEAWFIPSQLTQDPDGTIQAIKIMQTKLCLRSDLSVKNLEKILVDHDSKDEYIQERTRC